MLNTKKCSHCKAERPLSEFHKNRSRPDGLQVNCKPCTNRLGKTSKDRHRTEVRARGLRYYYANAEKARQYRKAHSKKIVERVSRWKKENPMKVLSYRRKKTLAKYGLDADSYDALLTKQNFVCAICGQPEHITRRNGRNFLCVDHDHVTNKVRGLLCDNCNNGIAMFKENKEFLLSAIAYLEHNGVNKD